MKFKKIYNLLNETIDYFVDNEKVPQEIYDHNRRTISLKKVPLRKVFTEMTDHLIIDYVHTDDE